MEFPPSNLLINYFINYDKQSSYEKVYQSVCQDVVGRPSFFIFCQSFALLSFFLKFLTSPSIFIIPRNALFVKRFFKFFQKKCSGKFRFVPESSVLFLVVPDRPVLLYIMRRGYNFVVFPFIKEPPDTTAALLYYRKEVYQW